MFVLFIKMGILGGKELVVFEALGHGDLLKTIGYIGLDLRPM